jgi:hypothetical protein
MVDVRPNARLIRTPNVAREVALHIDGGTLVFNGHTHEQSVHLFQGIAEDRSNHVVILTRHRSADDRRF